VPRRWTLTRSTPRRPPSRQTLSARRVVVESLAVEAYELIAQAWKAVEKAGVPEALQEVAFKEAVAILRETEADGPASGGTAVTAKPPATGAPAKRGPSRTGASRQPSTTDSTDVVDEDTFFRGLAHESGVTEDDLRDILNLTKDGKVQVTPPTRTLGKTQAEQAKTVIALVAGARSRGLGERPVSADAVRREVERKGCLQVNNFASKHLGPLKGFNAGSNKSEILTTSKWVDEFTSAVDRAHGRTSNDD
jgi:hypothetical protein